MQRTENKLKASSGRAGIASFFLTEYAGVRLAVAVH